MLTLEEIKEQIESNNPENREMLERANTIRKKHELHVCGIGLDSYLDKIQGIEVKETVANEDMEKKTIKPSLIVQNNIPRQ